MGGLAAALARGRLVGRKPKLSPKLIAEISRLHKEGRPVQEIADLFGVSRPTVYRTIPTGWPRSQFRPLLNYLEGIA
jgi:DNA invertase Pin-like site-specific DNA recombinase